MTILLTIYLLHTFYCGIDYVDKKRYNACRRLCRVALRQIQAKMQYLKQVREATYCIIVKND